jgi:hypothetical protein
VECYPEWIHIQTLDHSASQIIHANTKTASSQDWSHQVVAAALPLHKGIWENLNQYLHGTTKKDAQTLLRSKNKN